MGLLNNELRPHLEALTKLYKAEESKWMSKYNKYKNQETSSELQRQRLDHLSENLRQHGNKFFKAKDFNQALQMYTKSISAAMEGPLASLAYFNRCGYSIESFYYDFVFFNSDVY
jgi:hypothetical protein